MSSPEQNEYPDVLTSHSYDGIQEYDNPMPYWWKAIFWLTIFWSVFYVFAIELGYINKYEGDLKAEAEAIAGLRTAAQQDQPEVTSELLLAAAEDSDVLAQGEKHYVATCASCHGQQGEGLIGPNLVDDHWIHGGSVMDIHQVVDKGVTANGMPAWGAILGHQGTIAVSAYVHSIRGTDPPNAKAPQGEVWGEEPEETIEAEPTESPEDETEGQIGLDEAEPIELDSEQ